jgi:hypothetical protein
MQEISDLKIKELRALMGDHRDKFRMGGHHLKSKDV